ncbi:MAG: hypothetical protein FWD01_01825 [Defluviitaleaceae bacterium]|nr:hypothetical protein [Defluviitaleaceae bacterium]
MDLSKFKPYNFVPGIASATIAKHGIGFSKKAISELGNPDYVKLLMNTTDKQLALIVASKGEEGAIKCMEGRSPNENRNFRIGAKDLLHQVAFMMDCAFEELNYRVIGEYFNDNQVMLIDLNRAKKIGEIVENEDE